MLKRMFVFTLLAFSYGAAAQHSVFVGLLSDHYQDAPYMDFRDGQLKAFNDGGPGDNQLIGYRYQGDQWSAGLCHYNNTYYDPTSCVFAELGRRLTSRISVSAGINLTYGYREALLTQDETRGMGKIVLPITYVGGSYRFNQVNLAYQVLGMGAQVLLLEFEF